LRTAMNFQRGRYGGCITARKRRADGAVEDSVKYGEDDAYFLGLRKSE